MDNLSDYEERLSKGWPHGGPSNIFSSSEYNINPDSPLGNWVAREGVPGSYYNKRFNENPYMYPNMPDSMLNIHNKHHNIPMNPSEMDSMRQVNPLANAWYTLKEGLGFSPFSFEKGGDPRKVFGE